MRRRERQVSGRIGHPLDLGEIDAGEILEKIKRKIAAGLRKDHRYDAKRGFASLPSNGEFALVLLNSAEPMQSDQHDRRFGRVIVFSSARIQGKPGSRLRRSKNDFRPLLCIVQDRIDLRRVALVHARVADETESPDGLASRADRHQTVEQPAAAAVGGRAGARRLGVLGQQHRDPGRGESGRRSTAPGPAI
jgi:hypothetical protein